MICPKCGKWTEDLICDCGISIADFEVAIIGNKSDCEKIVFGLSNNDSLWEKQKMNSLIQSFELMEKAESCLDRSDYRSTNDKSLQYYIQAARMGNTEAKYKAGMTSIFSSNRSKEMWEKNFFEGLKWLKAAALDGHARAAYELIDLSGYEWDDIENAPKIRPEKIKEMTSWYRLAKLLAKYNKSTTLDEVEKWANLHNIVDQ